MSCRGVFFALTEEEAERVLTMAGDDALNEFIQEGIEERWDEDWLAECASEEGEGAAVRLHCPVRIVAI